MKFFGIITMTTGVVIGSLLAGGVGTWWSCLLSLGLMIAGMRMIERAERASGSEGISLMP